MDIIGNVLIGGGSKSISCLAKMQILFSFYKAKADLS